MGANVQDNGYFLGYSSTNDLIFDSEGRKWISSNVNTELKSDCHYIGSLSVLLARNMLGCNKELLKQTILKQDAVFRDQIHQLHRIYNTQRKLMDGIRRNELCKHNLRLEASWSSSSFLSINSQNIHFSPNLPWSTGQSSALIDGGIQLPKDSALKKCGKICPGPAPIVTEESLKVSKEAKYRKNGKQILDLQLPADKYINSEEGEILESDRVTEVLHVPSYSLQRNSQVVRDSNDKPHGTKSHGFAGADIISSGFSPAGLWRTPVSDFGQHSIAFQELPSFSYYASLDQSFKSLMKTAGFGRNELYRCISAKSGPNLDDQNFLVESSVCSRSKLFDLPSLGTNDPNKFQNSGSSDNLELVKYVKGSEDVGTSKILNLNITPGDYSDTPVSHRMQITGEENGLQDSISCLSWLKEKPVCDGKPRVSSDVQCLDVLPSEVFLNQSKTRSIEEIERGCIFDVTSPREHVPHLWNQMSADERNKSESLAGLIDLNSCMIEDKHKPMNVDFKAPVSPDNKECSPPRGESDENQLEALLQLAEQEDPEVREEPVRIAAEALVSISGFVAHDSLQMTTCSSSKSFLSNPLNWFAGIVSGTVNHPENEIEEVTEDLQTIEDLVASGTHLETGSLRSVGKNTLARGMKQSCASTSNNKDLKKLTNSTELGIEKRGLTSWGKACRKRRGQRVPITNLKFFLRSI